MRRHVLTMDVFSLLGKDNTVQWQKQDLHSTVCSKGYWTSQGGFCVNNQYSLARHTALLVVIMSEPLRAPCSLMGESHLRHPEEKLNWCGLSSPSAFGLLPSQGGKKCVLGGSAFVFGCQVLQLGHFVELTKPVLLVVTETQMKT